MAQLLYGNQYFTTTLNVGGGIDASQTTGIILADVTGIDTTKPGIALINYATPLVTSTCEWVEYTSINGSKELVGVTRGSEGFSAKTHSNGVTVAFPLSESHINRMVDALSIGGSASNGVTTTLDEDTMSSNSATALATQQSIKAYVDARASKSVITLDANNAILPDSNFASIGKTVGTNWVYKTLDFDQTTSESVYWYFRIPSDLSTITSCTAQIDWTAAAGTGTFTASIVTRSPSNDEVIDATTTPSSASAVTGTDTLIATGDLHQFSVAMTTTGWAAGDLIQMKFSRDVADTLSADAKVMMVTIELR